MNKNETRSFILEYFQKKLAEQVSKKLPDKRAIFFWDLFCQFFLEVFQYEWPCFILIHCCYDNGQWLALSLNHVCHSSQEEVQNIWYWDGIVCFGIWWLYMSPRTYHPWFCSPWSTVQSFESTNLTIRVYSWLRYSPPLGRSTHPLRA